MRKLLNLAKYLRCANVFEHHTPSCEELLANMIRNVLSTDKKLLTLTSFHIVTFLLNDMR